MTTYTVNMIDSETPAAWMDLPGLKMVSSGPQDSGRCRFTFEVEDVAAFEAALEADDNVLEYAVI